MGFPAVIELSGLDGANGFVVNGVIDADRSGVSVSVAGDINRDGIDDVLIGATRASPEGLIEAGSTYVVFGGSQVGTEGVLELSSLDGRDGFVLHGVNAGDRSGVVSLAGDFNGDGMDDILIGAYWASPGGRTRAGSAYVVFGKVGLGSTEVIELSALDGANGFVLHGVNAGEEAGYSVSAAGDINGDGLDDILIGAWYADPGGRTDAGDTYAVFGGTQLGNNGVFELADLDGNNGFVLHGVSSGDKSGRSVSTAGDVNGDGIADVLIGAYWADPGGRDRAGSTYVLFGGAQVGGNGVVELSSLDGGNGFVLHGEGNDDISGISVSGAGDVNADGLADLIIGGRNADPGGRTNAGSTYVVFGDTELGSGGLFELSDLDGSNGFVLHGVNREDWSGFSVSAAGDVNGDGVSDIMIGAYYTDPGGRNKAGSTYVVFGHTELGRSGVFELAGLDGRNGFVLHGAGADDHNSFSISAAGDVNGDGIDDVLTGAYFADPGGRIDAGSTYVVFGRNDTNTLPPVIVNAQLALDIGDTVVLTPQIFQAQSTQVDDEGLLWVVSGVKNGQFEQVSQPGKAVNEFPQGAVNRGEIQFAHDGSNSAPYFDAVVTDGVSRSEIQAGQIHFAGIPTLLVNQLTLDALLGQVTLTERELLADMQQLPATDILFTLSGVEHGEFIDSHNANQTTTQFTQAQVLNEGILFVGDGSHKTPSYSVRVSTVAKPDITSHPVEAQTSLCTEQGCSFRVAKNGFYIQEGGNTTLTSEHIHACSEAYWVNLGGTYTCSADSEGAAVTFFVDNPTACRFTYTENTQLTIATFTHAELESGQIQVKHDGHEIPPSYDLWVSNNGLDSRIYPGRIVYQSVNDAPYVAQGMAAFSGFVHEPFSLYVSSDTYGDADNRFEELTITAERVDGSPWPDGFFFDTQARRFHGEMNAPWSGDIRVTATDPGGLSATVQFPFVMSAQSKQSPSDEKNILERYGPYTSLVTLPVAACLFGYRQHKKRSYRRSKQLADAIRQELNLDVSNFSNDRGRDYVGAIDALITVLNSDHHGFYANLRECPGKVRQFAQAVAQAVRTHHISMPRAGWGYFAHCRGLRQMDLAEFRNHVSDIARTAVEQYNTLPNVQREVEMRGRASMAEDTAATDAWIRASDAGFSDNGTAEDDDGNGITPLAPFTVPASP